MPAIERDPFAMQLPKCEGCDDHVPTAQYHVVGDAGTRTARWCRGCVQLAALGWTGERIERLEQVR